MTHRIRPAAVAGMFYPENPEELHGNVQRLLSAVTPARTRRWPKALIVPHAGYVYSGPVAASAYAQLAPGKGTITRAVLFGPAHHVYIHGLSYPQAESFETPLGRMAVSQEIRGHIQGFGFVTETDLPHAPEHCLEVQLPFLQEVLGPVEIAPFLVGDASAHDVSRVMDVVWGGDETVVLVSSDLSHYLAYTHARRTDAATMDQVVHLAGELHHEQACGSTPISGMMEAARLRHLTPVLLDLRNSGDTAGDRSRVVGYGAVAFHEGREAAS